MNNLEINKVFGAVVGALLMFLLMGFFSESIYEVEKPRMPGYAVDVPETATQVAEAEEAEPEVDLPTLLASADPAAGEKEFRKCAACHKIEEGANAVGPHLWGVVGREAGSVEGFRYSGALDDVVEIWTFAELNAFIENPKGYAPGTSMSFAGVSDAEDRANILVYLNEADGSPEPLPEAGAPAEVEAAEAEAAPAEPAEPAEVEVVGAEAVEPESAAETEIAAVETEPAVRPADKASAVEAPEPAEVVDPEPAAEAPEAEAETEVAAVEPEAAEPEAAPAAEAADSAGALMAGLDADFAALLASVEPEDGKKVFRKCQACHRLEEGRNAVGPSLWGVIGRPVGGLESFSYSDAMAGFGGDWTYAQLDAYLTNPRDHIPGNKMSFAGLKKPEERAAVIAYINEADGAPEPLPAP